MTVPAHAGPPVDTAAGTDPAAFLEETLRWVGQGAWTRYRERLHPQARQAMAERRARTGHDGHNLSFWAHAREWKISRWQVESSAEGPWGTAVVVTREDHYLRSQHAWEEGELFEWLLVRTAVDAHAPVRWWILDRRHGTGNFPEDAITRGYADALRRNRSAQEVPADAGYAGQVQQAVLRQLVIPADIPARLRPQVACTVRIMADAQGQVLSRSVQRPSGHPGFDRAVVHAVDAAAPLPAPPPPLRDQAARGVDLVFRAQAP